MTFLFEIVAVDCIAVTKIVVAPVPLVAHVAEVAWVTLAHAF